MVTFAAIAPLMVPTAKAHRYKAAFFRSAKALLPLLKQGAATGSCGSAAKKCGACALPSVPRDVILCARLLTSFAFKLEASFMAAVESLHCQIDNCSEEVPPALRVGGLCLDHFLDESFARADSALEKCRRGESIDSRTLEWLLADVQITLNALSEVARARDLVQQSKILELLLCVANLNEYVAHHSVQPSHLS